MKAQIKSTRVALWSSALSCEPIDGCLRSLTKQLVRRQRHLRTIRENRDGEAVGDRQDAGQELGRSEELIASEEFGTEILGELVGERCWVGVACGPKPFGDQRFGLPDDERSGFRDVERSLLHPFRIDRLEPRLQRRSHELFAQAGVERIRGHA